MWEHVRYASRDFVIQLRCLSGGFDRVGRDRNVVDLTAVWDDPFWAKHPTSSSVADYSGI